MQLFLAVRHLGFITIFIGLLQGLSVAEGGPYLASGIKIGEVDQNTAIVWVRLTKERKARFDTLPIFTEGLERGIKDKLVMPTDVVPGMAGEVRVGYWMHGDQDNKGYTDWVEVTAETDFAYQFQLENLNANQRYHCLIEVRPSAAAEISASMLGGFKTAPTAGQVAPVRFIVTTCQAVRSIDSGVEGHVAYKKMLDFDPSFFVHTGDILYYDKAPLCKNVAQARAKWNLMFAYGHNLNFHRLVSSYFIKDDHDTLKNDCWPGQTYGDLTFDQGLQIFREQVPMGEKTYRTIRWGRDVQIWLTEHRDFRSSNRDPDGPNKTILGKEQKTWLMETIRESDATYKFLIVPGPIVGPDKKGKSDNHSNQAFAYEGQELRDFLSTQKNTYVICGDRHWQYCSKDPKTGLLEMGCGPINDQHMFGGHPGKHPGMHRYFGAKGGFLGVSIVDGEAKAEWFSVNGLGAEEKPLVIYTEKLGEE